MAGVPTLTEDLLSLIRQGKNQKIEYKEAWDQLPKSLFDTVSSFSNREGGDIFLGVHDCGVITGVRPESAVKLITSLGSLANNEDNLFPPMYLPAREYVYQSEGGFSGRDKRGKAVVEQPGEYHIIHIHVPEGTSVVRHANRIYDRNNDADIDITNNEDMVYQCYARKQSTYYVNKVYPYWGVSDLRHDLIERARKMATARMRRDGGAGPHKWETMDDEELLRSAGLILTDATGSTGITLAAVLLFGTDNMIMSACAHHKVDCIYRVYNLDRYDDRDVIDPTNLLDAYERMFDFGQKHLNDLFVLDGIQSVSARDAILREVIANILMHRDYSSGYVSRMVIGRDRIQLENANRAHGIGALSLATFIPYPKNPSISKVFREVGLADELGSGMRNSYKYSKLYSGADPLFVEGDVFQTTIPLTTGSLIKVGPVASDKEDDGSGEVVTIALEAAKLNSLLEYCEVPRTRSELQEFCGGNSRSYFFRKILQPLLSSGRLRRTIPDVPNSPNQRYVRA